MRPWKLAETNYAQVREAQYQVAVLPFGATEPHNLHLPYSNDTLEAELIGEKLCQAAWQRGAKVVLLPTIPYGTQTNQSRFALAMNLNPSTLLAVVTDLVESLVRSKILKIVLLNSHGGNDLKPVLRELYGRTPAHLFLCNWYTVFSDVYHQLFDEPDNHAGEMETSLALAWWPELVARREDGTLAADEGQPARCRFRAVEEGWVSIGGLSGGAGPIAPRRAVSLLMFGRTGGRLAGSAGRNLRGVNLWPHPGCRTGRRGFEPPVPERRLAPNFCNSGLPSGIKRFRDRLLRAHLPSRAETWLGCVPV